MKTHRLLSLIGIVLIAGLIMFVFYLSTLPPKTNYTNQEQLSTEIKAPLVTFIDPVRGATTPQVTIVEFSDFTCFACQEMASTLDRLLNDFPNDVQHVFKVLPNSSLDSSAEAAAEAAYCAHQQGRFFEYHDLLFANYTILTEQTLVTLASDIGLDVTKFTDCLQSEETLPLIERNIEEAVALSITAMPTLFIGEERFIGNISYTELRGAIEQLIIE